MPKAIKPAVDVTVPAARSIARNRFRNIRIPDKRYALQAVGRPVEIMELGDWGKRTLKNQFVVIGSPFDAEKLRRKFAACIRQP